jgi:hypothetical protein
MIPLATGDGLQPIEEIDFDCGIAWEPAAMREAKRRLTEIGASWTQRGAWLRIRLTPHAALYLCPGSGSIRFEKGQIFSSRGWPLAEKIVRAYLEDPPLLNPFA